MLNKFFKRIHNKYSRFFKFIFFLRYLFAIFIAAISLFFTIPMFFDYEKKAQFIKNYLKNDYNFDVRKYSNIRYNAYPFPRLELENVKLKLKNSQINLNVSKLKIYPKILSIYNFNDFKAKKIILIDSNTDLESTELKNIKDLFLNPKKELSFNNLNIKISDENKIVLNLENLNFANFGYRKNLIKGEAFKKNFEFQFGDNLEAINFKLLNTGINAKLSLNEAQIKGKKSGNVKSRILNSNIKFNFDYGEEEIKIDNFYFRNKNISFNNVSSIILNPFLDINTNFIIEEFNPKILKKISFNQILKLKEKIKKINSTNIIYFKPQKFSKNLVNNLNLKINLAYGRINYKKKFFIADNIFDCEGNLNILEEFPVLFFDCFTIIDQKKEFLKKFSIKMNVKKDRLKLTAKGNLNIVNKKINFDNVSVNDESFLKEDLKYFKKSFENILLDKSFYETFNIKKIKNFILEVI